MRNPICLMLSAWKTVRSAPTGTWIDGCDYVEEGTYKNCSVQVLRCVRCGAYSIAWSRETNGDEIQPKATKLPWYLKDKCGHPIEFQEGKRRAIRIICQNIRKITG